MLTWKTKEKLYIFHTKTNWQYATNMLVRHGQPPIMTKFVSYNLKEIFIDHRWIQLQTNRKGKKKEGEKTQNRSDRVTNQVSELPYKGNSLNRPGIYDELTKKLLKKVAINLTKPFWKTVTWKASAATTAQSSVRY